MLRSEGQGINTRSRTCLRKNRRSSALPFLHISPLPITLPLPIMTSLKFLTLKFVAVLLAAQVATAAPAKKKVESKKTPVLGEHPRQQLPKGTPQVHGLAKNWTKPIPPQSTGKTGIQSYTSNNGSPVS